MLNINLAPYDKQSLCVNPFRNCSVVLTALSQFVELAYEVYYLVEAEVYQSRLDLAVTRKI